MPGTISSGVFERFQKEYNICILNLFYEGEGDINRIIKTAISNISSLNRKSQEYVQVERIDIPSKRENRSVN